MQAFQLPVAQAERDLYTALSEWEKHGLLGRRDEAPASATGNAATDDEVIPGPQTRVHDFPAERRYRMFETVFRLRFSDTGMVPVAQSAFAHLAVDEHCPFDVSLDLQHDAQGYFLLRDDEPIGWGQTERQLAPLLHGQVVDNATRYHPVRALVFPVYRAGADARLERLTPADALCRLTDAGTDMEGGLNSASVTELVSWIAGMDSYELHYSELEDAIAQVRDLLS